MNPRKRIESVFIEISEDQLQANKNILIGVIHRPPATDVRSFNINLNVYLDKIRKENKICYLLGDFNINLRNHDTHNLTGEFYDLMTSNSFLPLITRPTKFTVTSATLIDNIFTNCLENRSHSVQGLMVTDISYHYPIFHVIRQVKAKDKTNMGFCSLCSWCCFLCVCNLARALYNWPNKEIERCITALCAISKVPFVIVLCVLLPIIYVNRKQ